MHQIIQALPLKDVKNCIKWQKRIKHLHIIAGNKNYTISFYRKEKNTWQESSPWKRHAISVSWPTLMREKPLLQSVFFSIQDAFIKLAKHMKVLHKWTGWNKSKTAELRSLLQLLRLNGMTIVLISLIHLGT